MGLSGKHVLLGVTGSISAYKACDLVQRLKDSGATVRVIMTPSAAKLVHPNTFAALTGHAIATDAFSGIETGAMEHIDLARWADIYLIAPCTAHTLGELAHGLTGSLVSLIYMAFERRVYLAPAMNSVMLQAPAVQRNLASLKSKGDIVLPTGEGVLACGEVGYGKLLDVVQIIAFLQSHLTLSGSQGTPSRVVGKKILISLGHTREKWDDVRFLSNRSSGKTGLALARVLHLAGAEVELVAGVMEEALPPGMAFVRVESSADFHREMLARQPNADIVIMSAAIADFVPSQVHAGKQKGSKSLAQLELKPFPNILSELGARKPHGQILVGFALETTDALAQGELKMKARNCDALVVNDPVAEKTGFGKDGVMAAILVNGKTSQGVAPRPDGLREMHKDELAAALTMVLNSLLDA